MHKSILILKEISQASKKPAVTSHNPIKREGKRQKGLIVGFPCKFDELASSDVASAILSSLKWVIHRVWSYSWYSVNKATHLVAQEYNVALRIF